MPSCRRIDCHDSRDLVALESGGLARSERVEHIAAVVCGRLALDVAAADPYSVNTSGLVTPYSRPP
jgi:hypothetical protein